MQINKWIGMAVGLLIFAACDQAGDGSSADAPLVDISCDVSKCAVSGLRDAVVQISLSGCSPSQIDFESVSSGSADLICSGSSCSGTVSQWSPSSIAARTYYICGWIDIDSNGIKNSNDVFSEDQEFVSGSTLTMNSWSVTYSFSRKIRNK